MDIEKIRKGYDDFMLEVCREGCANRRGLKDEINTTKIFEKYEWTYSEEVIKLVKKALETAEGDEHRRLRLLLHELIVTRIGAIIAPIEDELTTMEAKATIEWEEKPLALRMISVVMKEEASQEKRKELYNKIQPWREKFTKLQQEIWTKKEEESKKLGYEGYLDLQKKLKNVDYFELLKIARKLLIATEKTYADNLERRKKEYDLSHVESFDVSFMLNDQSTKDKFPCENLIPMLRKFLNQMDINMDAQTNIIWDLETREKKVHRACCYSIRVPEEIYVITQPTAGKDDAITLFHEAGHAEHHAFAEKDLAWEFKYFGLNSTSETWSYLFDHLFMNIDFLHEFTTLTDEEIKGMLDKMWFKELYFIRRYSAKCLYEYKFWTNDLRKLDENWENTDEKYDNMGECYAEILSKATMMKFYPHSHILDMDAGFYAFEYFKAWLSEAQVRKFLEKKAGMQWWKNKEAQDIVKNFWKSGNKLRAEEIVQQLGYPALREDELVSTLPK